MRRAITISTRVPEPGQTKTRMIPALSAKGCARLHAYFSEDIKRECGKVKGQLSIHFAPDEGRGLLHPIFGRGEYYISQRGGGLGGQMYQAIQEVLDRGYDACILMGTDVPEVRAEYPEQASGLLGQEDMVLGPTRGGGYYLAGVKKPRRAVFEVEGYGQSSMLRDTVHRIKTEGCTTRLTEAMWDMDVYQDLQGYRRRIRESKRLQNAPTGRYLTKASRISIIIPVYDGEKTICQIQDQLEPLRGVYEILFVDGGSTDRTMKQIHLWVKVIHSREGRTKQIDTGARKSRGGILFFLHCDSELPSRPLAEIRRMMKDYSAGCFGIAFHSRSFFVFICRVISSRRIKDRRVMFGDQGISVDRSLSFHAGIFPEVPMVEDYQFSLTLKKRGIELDMIGRHIYTSDRCFPKGTLPKLKLMWKMNRLHKIYRNRVSVELTDRMCRDMR